LDSSCFVAFAIGVFIVVVAVVVATGVGVVAAIDFFFQIVQLDSFFSLL
jgi:hypothetical protein